MMAGLTSLKSKTDSRNAQMEEENAKYNEMMQKFTNSTKN